MMNPAHEQCPICGGELVVQRVEKLLRGGSDTAIVEVDAEVCVHCGERLYPPDAVRRFELIRDQLERHDVAQFKPIGRLFQVT